MYPSQKKIWAVAGGFTSTFCRLLPKQDLNQSSDTPRIPQKYKVANKISWFTRSAAFAKSQKIRNVVNRFEYTTRLTTTRSVATPFLDL
jgi:hypothetical protein